MQVQVKQAGHACTYVQKLQIKRREKFILILYLYLSVTVISQEFF